MPLLLTVLKFIKDNWKIVLIATAVIGLILYIQYLRSTISSNELQISKLTFETKTLTANNELLVASLTVQNEAISKISEAMKISDGKFKQLETNISKQTTSLVSQLDAIIKEDKPTSCEDTIKYLIDANKGYPK